MSDVSVTLFSDPLSVAAYRNRPTQSRLRHAFDDVDRRYRCLVSIPTPIGGEDAAAGDRERFENTGEMPVDSALTADGLPSSWPACEAVAAAREAGGSAAAFDLARAIADRTFAGGDPPATPEDVGALATSSVGVDAERVADAVGGRRATAAVGRDLERARRTVSLLPAVDVRGTPGTEPLRPRSCLDGPGTGTRSESAFDTDSSTEEGTDLDAGGGDSDTDGGGTDSPDDAPSRTEAAVFAAPVYRIDGPAGTTIVDGAAGFPALREAIRTHDPDLGDTGERTETHSRNVMQQYGTDALNAESFSPEDHGERALDVLGTLRTAFTPEIAACLDVTAETCRIALHRLKREGSVKRETTGAWTRVPEE
ncbi:hypothetical protein [Halobellus litoreus]|uniref:HTH domain-containing protein n=1 Tax=Halobellus litoreus TaxID=755310 RepID=A0ABD6DZ99_9EURY|nr:hypothetical protein [Halobellus litoreus]